MSFRDHVDAVLATARAAEPPHACGYDCALTALVTAGDCDELAAAARLAVRIAPALEQQAEAETDDKIARGLRRQVATMRTFYRCARNRLRKERQ